MQTPFMILMLGCMALISPGTATCAQEERHLEGSDLRKLGQAIGEYIVARTSDKGVGEAEGDVQSAMDKLERKLAKTPAAGNVLASAGDMGHAIWLSYQYSKKRPKKGKVYDTKYVEVVFSKSEPLHYAVWAPSKYSARNGPYPLILSIPEEGVSPAEHIANEWSDPDLRAGAIIASPIMPEDTKLWQERDGIAHTLVLMRAIYESYAVDFDRIFLAGRGLGVAAAVSIADKFPDRFAGVIGRAGDLGDTPAENFKNLPTFFAGGGARSSAFAEASKALGYDNCTLQAEASQGDIWAWIQSTRRDSYPQEIVLIPGAPFPKRSYWLEVPPSEGTGSRIHAKLDRQTNTITVDGVGMTSFTLHFNDVLLDMDRPIKVIANGQEYVDAVPRSRTVLLQSLFNGSCDPGRVFVNSKFYHLPSLAEDSGGE